MNNLKKNEMINEILTQLRIIEERLNGVESMNIPDYLKVEELKILNEELDELKFRVDNL